MKLLEDMTREPGLYGNPDAKITLVGFGSTKMEVLDFIEGQNTKDKIQNRGSDNKSDTLSSVPCTLS
jgi:pyruvate/2-oxoacid:ferredoxin oxidoreductase alpha subunit